MPRMIKEFNKECKMGTNKFDMMKESWLTNNGKKSMSCKLNGWKLNEQG